MSDLSNSPDHGGVTDEQMEQFFAEHPDLRPLGQTHQETEGEPLPPPPPAPPETEPAPEPVPTEGETGEPQQPATPETPPPSTDDFLEIEGRSYPRSQIQAAAQFQQKLVSDPQLQRLITDYLTGATIQQQEQAAPEPIQPPAEIDLDDPSLRALYNLVQKQSEQIQQLTQSQRTVYDASVNSQKQQIDAQYNTAADAFGKDHSLERDDVDHLGQIAARLGVLPQLMQGIDPITGSPSSPDPIRAFQRALEIAMYSVPEYRDREFRRSVVTQQQESQKRKLLGAVGGSSGSVARTTTPPKPGSPEARKAMLAEVGAMLNGEWSDPTAN